MSLEQSQPIPTEKGWPLLGILPKFLSGDPFKYLKDIMLERGDLVLLKIGPQPVYLVSHPDYIQRILRDNYQNYAKPGLFYDIGRRIAKNGLITSSGDFWLRQRRMIQPQLHRKQLENLFKDMRDAIVDVLADWDALAENGTQVEFGKKMGEITSHVITQTMFGKGTLSAAEVAEAGLRITGIVEYTGKTVYTSFFPKWIPIAGQKKFERDLNATHEIVYQIIAKCRQDKEASNSSLIQMLINSVDEESHEQMTEQQLFDEVITIFVAGYETAATALTWVGVILQNHLDVLEKLRAEIDQVLGGRAPSFEDVPRLSYTRRVFMEVLRMYAPVPFLPRVLNEADRLGNYNLPAGALLLVFYHGVQHNPHVWENPEVFEPDRFIPERMAGQHPFAYLSFSAGPRKCAGDDFALLEGTLAIAMMLQKYDVNIIPNQTFTPSLGVTMRPGNGVKVTFSRRSLPI